MTDKIQKIRKEVERLQNELIQEKEKGYGSDVDDACILELQNVLTYIDSLQEETVSEQNLSNVERTVKNWKDAQGDDLPEIDREVIALLDNGKVVYAHRPPEYWDGKNIITGKVTRYYPKTYDKGGWNIPDVKIWLDYDINELLCRENETDN